MSSATSTPRSPRPTGSSRASIWVHRHQPVPMECRGLIASYDRDAEHLTIHTATQSPHMFRMLLPPQINVPMEKIRVLADDVGGGFGLKNGVHRDEVAVVAASIDLGRPVKWIEDRLEHLAVGGQAREEMADIEAAVTADGVLLGVRMDVMLNLGAYPATRSPARSTSARSAASFQGPTKLEGIAAKHAAVFSNKATYVSYRGPWATGDFLRERMLDVDRARARARPARRPPPQLRRARRAAARDAHRPAVRRRSRPRSRSSRPPRSRTGTTSAAPGRGTRRGSVPRASAWRRTSRRRRARRSPARPTWPP